MIKIKNLVFFLFKVLSVVEKLNVHVRSIDTGSKAVNMNGNVINISCGSDSVILHCMHDIKGSVS
jgi:hypothetical protein